MNSTIARSTAEDVRKIVNNYNQEAICSNGIQTIPIEHIEYYLQKYQEFSKVKTTDRVFFKALRDLKYSISYQYFRTFAIHENSQYKAKAIEELPEVIQKVESEFDAKILTAQTYFGSCLDGPFYFGISVSEGFMPHSIKEILNRDIFEWHQYIINRGYPQPIYVERYNDILKQAIEKFINIK